MLIKRYGVAKAERCRRRGEISTDENIYVIGFVAPLITTIIALILKGDSVVNYLMAGMSAIGGIIGIYFFLGLGSDGDITQTTGSTTTAIASATLNANTWQLVVLIPLAFALTAFMAAIYRAWKGFT